MSARKWTIRGLAGAALLACATGRTPAQTPTAPTAPATAAKPAALVNGEPISMADVENMVRMAGPTAGGELCAFKSGDAFVQGAG